MTVDNRAYESVLRYASGEEVRVGDIVMEPVNAWDAEAAPVRGWDPVFLHEAFGKITHVMRPGSNEARLAGFPDGCSFMEWRSRPGTFLESQESILDEDSLFFVARG